MRFRNGNWKNCKLNWIDGDHQEPGAGDSGEGPATSYQLAGVWTNGQESGGQTVRKHVGKVFWYRFREKEGVDDKTISHEICLALWRSVPISLLRLPWLEKVQNLTFGFLCHEHQWTYFCSRVKGRVFKAQLNILPIHDMCYELIKYLVELWKLFHSRRVPFTLGQK